MPKILHLRTVTGHGGGPEKTLLNSPRFIGDGYDLHLAYIRPEHDMEYNLPTRAADAGVSFFDIPERGRFDLRTLWRLSKLVRELRPDILHAHDYKTNVLAILLGKWHGLTKMTTVHGYVTLSTRLNFYYRIDRWALQRMDHVVAVSKDLYSEIIRWGIPAARCSLVENAIDTAQYSRQIDVTEAKKRLGVPPNRVLIGTVGRLSKEKAFDNLIYATDNILRTGLVDIELMIIGEGDERERLQALIAKLGRTDRINLLGYQPNTIALYQAMDIFALASLREAFPNVLLEALATEVPVVSTRVAGVPQIIEHEQNGLLVDANNLEQLTSTLQRLISDASLRKRLRTAGRRTVEERFCFGKRMQKIRGIYDQMLGRASAVPTISATNLT